MNITIQYDNLEDALKVDMDILEFEDHYTKESYIEKLTKQPHLVLTAYNEQGKPVGYKIGYDRYKDGSFYSWMGGVHPAYRKQGVAKNLAIAMESWCKEQKYKSIKMKTRNRYKPMLIFALKYGYNIIDMQEDKKNILDTKFTLEKKL